MLVVRRRLAPLLLAGLLGSCVLVDRPLLALRSVSGGIHNRRQVSGVDPFFLDDGRMGIAANGALLVERVPHGPLVLVLDRFHELDDPDGTPDGKLVVAVSGEEQVTAGGGHNDHVFQVVALELASGRRWRVTRSRRAESFPRVSADGTRVVFARRAEYDGWSLSNPWGPASLFACDPDGKNEERLTEPLFHPLLGLAFAQGDGALWVAGVPAEGAGAGRPCLLRVPYPAGGAPELVRVGAYLPAPLRGTSELLCAFEDEDGTSSLVRLDAEGRTLESWALPVAGRLGGLAVSPDGRRAVFSDLDPEALRFGAYRLWTLQLEAGVPVLLETLEWRNPVRYKPLDVVKPPSWWFRPQSSPGSR